MVGTKDNPSHKIYRLCPPPSSQAYIQWVPGALSQGCGAKPQLLHVLVHVWYATELGRGTTKYLYFTPACKFSN